MSNQNAGILRLSIDVTKIDKARLYKGQKGTYLDVSVLMKDQPDQYDNDGMAVQDLGKEAREAGEKGAILGNAKWVVRPEGESARPPVTRHPDGSTSPFYGDAEDNDDIPF